MRRPLLAALILASAGQAPLSARAAGVETPAMPGYVAVPLHRTSNYIVLETQIDGHGVPLLLDTGSPRTVISQSAASYSLPRGAEAMVPANVPHKFSVNGKPATAAWVQDMKAGAMNFGSGPVGVTDLFRLRQTSYQAGHEHRNAEGLIGLDLLKNYGAIIDPARQVVYFNTDPAQRAHLGPLLEQSGWVPIPMSISSSGHLSVPTEIEGLHFGLEVDTGAETTAVDPGRLASLRLTAKNIPVRMQILNLESVRVQSLVIKNWKIGDFTIPSFPVALLRLPPALINGHSAAGPTLGLLGAEVLLINHAIIDVGGMKLFLHPY